MSDGVVETNVSAGNEEKLIPQSMVNSIVAREKAEAAERARKSLEVEFQEKYKSPAIDKDALYAEFEQKFLAKNMQDRRAEEERKKAEEEAAVQAEFKRITQEYDAKLSLGKGSYDDYDEVMAEFPHAMHNALVLGTVNLPNTYDVMYYLANHPVRANELENTAARNWKGFMKELNSLSKSLLENKEAAAREPKIRAPITRNKSDSVGSNSIDRSWEDLAKDPSLRF